MRKGVLLVTVLMLAFSIAVTPSATAACAINQTGTIKVPTFTQTPPPGMTPLMHTHLVYFMPVPGGGNFELSAVANPGCGGGFCNPDFNLVFQKPGSGMFADQVGPTYSEPGTVSGPIPAQAEWAMIWMRHGPDVPNGDGNLLLAVFNFGRNC